MMNISAIFFFFFLFTVFCTWIRGCSSEGAAELFSGYSLNHPLAPALYVFGDSLADSGNNNFLPTVAKADYLPYGANFVNGFTGRFTNGRTVPDFIAEFLGLPLSPPYLSIRKSTPLAGVNYASGSCGILPESGNYLGKCLNLKEQIKLFQMTAEMELPIKFKSPQALATYLSKSIFVVLVGSNDYLNNYLKPYFYDTSKRYSPQAFARLLIDKLAQSFEKLLTLGARKIVMFEIGPIGCIPSIRKDIRYDANRECVAKSNQLVSYFNAMLSPMLQNFTSSFKPSTFVLGSVNALAHHAIQNPSLYGLADAENACCTTWLNGTASCIPELPPCPDAGQHFFWDAFHLTEAAYSLLAAQCITNDSVCRPMNLHNLVRL